jgi:hypothetical protein
MPNALRLDPRDQHQIVSLANRDAPIAGTGSNSPLAAMPGSG